MTRTVEVDDIISSVDIADLLSVSAPAVSNWKLRDKNFPQPFATVARGNTDLYLKSKVVYWYMQKKASPELIRIIREA